MTSEEWEKAVSERTGELFGQYWARNYHDGCVIALADWHRPKFEQAVAKAVRQALREVTP